MVETKPSNGCRPTRPACLSTTGCSTLSYVNSVSCSCRIRRWLRAKLTGFSGRAACSSSMCGDAIEHNELGQLTQRTIASYFDKDPPAFYEVPFGYHDRDKIQRVLRKLGFTKSRLKSSLKWVGQAGQTKPPLAWCRETRWPWRSPNATPHCYRSSPRP